MAQSRSNRSQNGQPGVPLSRGVREGALFFFGALAIYLLVSLLSYSPNDPGWSHSQSDAIVTNYGGMIGAWFADITLYLFGYLAFLLPIIVAAYGWTMFKGRSLDAAAESRTLKLRVTGYVLAMLSGCGLSALHFSTNNELLPFDAGGILGQVIGFGLVDGASFLGATLFLLVMFLVGVTMATGLSWLGCMDALGRICMQWFERMQAARERRRAERAVHKQRKKREVVIKAEVKKQEERKPVVIDPPAKPLELSARAAKERQIPLFVTSDSALPPLSLLDDPTPHKHKISTESLEAVSRLLELKLRDFGIQVEVVAVHPGPVITRYEIQPAPGVKVSQISTLSKDLARSLSVMSVRVVEVIPGKSTVGLEIPNEHRETVRLSEVLRSKAYEEVHSPLTLALGKDISGLPTVADLAKMPHLLVAGTTGSGKSVAMNAMVLSLLYKATAQEVRLIMIDPKMLELSVYEGIPHLLAPVVTDMKEASNALRWCVAEMERRYKLMAALGVRNITGFNKKVKEAVEQGEPIRDPLFRPIVPDADIEHPLLQPLPYIVVLIDELADMMMVVGKKVEELIARLAQKARASGIHLILATQRPSVDVITGLIKANIPTRMAFQVSSKIDSRTILDQMGAETLLGWGDMLYLPPGTALPVRVHGAFVDDHEVHRVVEELKRLGAPDYIEDILQGPAEGEGMLPGESGGGGGGEDADPLYDEALRFITETRRASVSGVQRKFKIGYNRAARLVEEMERSGVVSAVQANGMREVLAPPPPEL